MQVHQLPKVYTLSYWLRIFRTVEFADDDALFVALDLVLGL